MSEREANKLLEKNGLEWEEFANWMIGQTIDVIDGVIYYFDHDVHRYIKWKKEGKPTYFD